MVGRAKVSIQRLRERAFCFLRCLSLFRALGTQDSEGAHEFCIHDHHPPSVVKLATIVWRGKNCNQPAPTLKLVPVLHDLVSTAHQIQAMFVEKLGEYILPKRVGHSTIRFLPS